MAHAAATGVALTEQVTCDVTGFGLKARTGFLSEVQAAYDKWAATPPSPTAVEADGWTAERLEELLNQLTMAGGKNQAAIIAACLAQPSGQLTREQVYALLGWPETKVMKGFTRPVRRIVKAMKADGTLPEDAIYPFEVLYTGTNGSWERAKGFKVPASICSLV